MSKDRLSRLLQQADRAAGSARPSGTDLADRVRRSARRRHNIKIIVPMAAALMLAVGLLHWAHKSTAPLTTSSGSSINVAQNLENQAPPSSVDVSQFQAAIAQLQAEAEAGMQVIRELRARERQQARLAELERQLAAIPDPVAEIQRQMDKAAYTMVYHADRKYNQINLKDSAIQDYQRVVKLYPQTRWAEVARNKLSEIRYNLKGALL